MNARERVLAILLGALVIGFLGYWSVGRFQTAMDDRRQTLESKQTLRDQMDEQRLGGEYAANQLGEFITRAMPGNVEESSRQYAGWLLQLAQENKFDNVIVDPMPSVRGGDLYSQMSFRVAARADMPRWLRFTHAFYEKDRLHRIRSWSLRPSKQGDLQIEMTVDALAMDRRPEGLPMPTGPSNVLKASLADYESDILNRNFFEPSNQPPKFKGDRTLVAKTGSTQTLPISFEDPEGNRLTYELIDAPEAADVSLGDNGALRIKGDFPGTTKLLVRVSDDGYPSRSVEQSLVVRFEDPPAAEEPPPPPEKFDEAKQTVMVATVRGRGASDPADPSQSSWMVWLRIRTLDKTLRLKVNDEFEIGSVEGIVTAVGPGSATIQVDGQRFKISPNEKLIDAINGEALTDAADRDETTDEASENEGPDNEGPENGASENEASDNAGSENAGSGNGGQDELGVVDGDSVGEKPDSVRAKDSAAS